MEATPRDLATFDDFFPVYVGEHSKALTRWIHFAGTHCAAALLAAALLSRRPRLLAGVPLAGYGPAWFSHFAVERNRPATFGHPVWALRGDLTMIGMMWRGRDAELGTMAERVKRERPVVLPGVEGQPAPAA